MIKLFRNIEDNFKTMRVLCIVCIITSGAVSIFTIANSSSILENERNKVYIVDKNGTITATRSDASKTKTLEIQSTVSRFHELMFNLAPSAVTIEENLEKAYSLSDKSAYNYVQDLTERGFYNRLISANISQQIVVDSIDVNTSSYPYRVKTFSRNYVLRESSISVYIMETSCNAVDIERSTVNPSGILLEKFTVVKNDLISTERRR